MKPKERIALSLGIILLLLVSSNNLLISSYSAAKRGDTATSYSDQGQLKGGAISSSAGTSSSQYQDISSLVQNGLQDPTVALRPNGTYQLVWEPNRVQGSVHAVAVLGTIVAIAAGYLYDNEIHIYRWNASIPGPAGLTHAFDIGDGLFHSDILSIAFGDTDRDGYLEVIASTADGGIYVFEQLSSRGPADPLYYQFQLVWNTSVGKRVTSIAIDDLDGDGLREIIAGSWTQKVYDFEYAARIGQPGTPDHKHYYSQVWDSGSAIHGLVNSVATGDTTFDGFREIIAGASDGKVYVFENQHGSLAEPFFPHADNSYIETWNSTNKIPGPVQTLTVSNSLDADPFGEIGVISGGHGAYVFDYQNETGMYVMNKLMRGVEGWENDPHAQFPIDPYVDLKVSGNNVTDGVFEPWQILHINDPCILIPNNPYCTQHQENATAIAGQPDFSTKSRLPKGLTLLNGTAAANGLARVVLDFGRDEELTGGGNGNPDLTVYGLEKSPQNVTLDNLNISISQDGSTFVRLKQSEVITKRALLETQFRRFNITIDVDPTLGQLGWEWFRYIKLETTAQLFIDAIVGSTLYRPVTDGVSASIGFVPVLGTSALIIGTVTGSLKAFAPNGTSYQQIWDSYRPIPLYQPNTTQTRIRFSMNSNIWSIARAFGFTPGIGSRFFLVVGTNPKVAFVELDATTLEAHVAWDTGNVLDKWTVSVSLANTDSDSSLEIVVGSFDNNIYIFDHVFRNTYRRAWRSPDLTHNQTIWDHVNIVTVGDIDGDGTPELLAATDNQTYPIIHVFEKTGNNTFAPWQLINLPLGSGPISGMEISNDLDNDGAKEVVAIGAKNVYSFEIINGNIATSGFSVIPSRFGGQLLALATGDADNDGRGEIIVGGWLRPFGISLAPPPPRGLLGVFENNGTAGVYQLVWAPPVNQTLNSELRVLSLAIGDQNNNGRQEIIAGHTFGVTVYENTGDDTYQTTHIITSSPAYPYYHPQNFTAPLPDNYVPSPNNSFEGRGRSPAPVVQLENGTYVAVYTTLDHSIDHTPQFWNESRIFYATSRDKTTWSTPTRLTFDSQYSQPLYYERNPSAVAVGNAVWVAYEVKFLVGSEFPIPSPADIWLYATLLGTTQPSLDLQQVALKGISPSIFWNASSTSVFGGTLGVTYLNYTQTGGGSNMLFLVNSVWNRFSLPCAPIPCFRFYFSPRWGIPQMQNTKIGMGFNAYSQRAVMLADGSLSIAFDGYNTTSRRTSWDIWFMATNGKAQQANLVWNKPRWISNSTLFSASPSITLMQGNVLTVVYQQIEIDPPLTSQQVALVLPTVWNLLITVSTNNGTTWTTPRLLPTPSGSPFAPSVTMLKNGGFILSYLSSLSTLIPSGVTAYIATNTLVGWWRYTISQGQALALGDTDGNGINEIIAGSLNQIFILELKNPGAVPVYEEKWISQALAQNVTDIALGDINGDGTPEIVVTAMAGNVYAFEWIIPS